MRSPHERSYQFGVCISAAASRRTTSTRSSSVTRGVPRRFAALALSGAVAPLAARLRCFIGSPGAFCMRVCPQGFGVYRAAPCASSPHAAAPHLVMWSVPRGCRRRSWGCEHSPQSLMAATPKAPRCTLGGTPQPLHICHVLRSDTSF